MILSKFCWCALIRIRLPIDSIDERRACSSRPAAPHRAGLDRSSLAARRRRFEIERVAASMRAERGVVGDAREAAHRGELEDRAELEGLADQRDADVRDLDAALRDQADEALGLEPLQRLARRPERNVQQRAQLALRHELARHQVALEELRLEALVGDLAHQRSGLGLSSRSGHP